METKLWSALIGLSKTVDSNPKTEHTDSIIMDCLQHLKNHIHPCGNTSDYDMSLINDKKKELMNQILNLSDMNFIYRGLCYLGFDIDDSYIDELIEEVKK